MDILERIKELIDLHLEEYKAELVDLQLKGSPGRFRLCIIADKVDGISVDECANISRNIARNEELDELLGSNYQLEVTSPGVSRPLKNEPDFLRKIGKDLEIIIDTENKKKIKGKLKEVTKDGIYLEKEKEQIFVRFKHIIKAVQALPW